MTATTAPSAARFSLTDLWNACPLAVVDVETTGLDPAVDRVIEIAIIHMCGGQVVERWSTLVNPEREVPEDAVRITGIQPEELVGAPTFGAIASEVRRRLDGHVFCAYNLAFDRAFIRAELERAGLTWVDTQYVDPLVFARELHRGQGAANLGAVAARLGIELTNAHRAAADAEVAGLVLYALAAQLPDRLQDLIMLQAQWAQQQENERAGWKNRRGPQLEDGLTKVDASLRGNSLGPAYLYGDDTDPVRAMFVHLPDSGSKR